jgi:tRNA(Ile)-lysidine synthase
MFPDLKDILRSECQLTPDRPVLVGVSGGPDSLCLMEVIRQAGYPLVAAHFDHRLRPESAAEAETLAAMLAERDIPLVMESGDVRGLAGREGLSIEEAARRLRYRCLFAQAHAQAAQAVAVGHTADDQVETVLMHLLRGAGLTGLKGMHYRTCLPEFDPQLPLVRPLLGVWRAEVERYCQINDLQPLQDASNRSREFLRNRVRHVLLPQLEEYNPRIRAALWRSARTLADDYAILDEFLERAWQDCVLSEGAEAISFDAARLLRISPAQQRYLVRRALERLARESLDLRYDVLEGAVAYLETRQDGQRDLSGGVRLVREGGEVIFALAGAKTSCHDWPQMSQPEMSLSLPGQVVLAGGWRLNFERMEIEALDLNQALHCGDPFQAWLDADRLPGELRLRVRRPGDRFQPLGMGGHSIKLSDFYINEKLPRQARANWPLLCAGEAIVWVPGYRPAHPYRLTGDTRQVLALALTTEGKWEMES